MGAATTSDIASTMSGMYTLLSTCMVIAVLFIYIILHVETFIIVSTYIITKSS